MTILLLETFLMTNIFFINRYKTNWTNSMTYIVKILSMMDMSIYRLDIFYSDVVLIEIVCWYFSIWLNVVNNINDTYYHELQINMFIFNNINMRSQPRRNGVKKCITRILDRISAIRHNNLQIYPRRWIKCKNNKFHYLCRLLFNHRNTKKSKRRSFVVVSQYFKLRENLISRENDNEHVNIMIIIYSSRVSIEH